jgi:hypothetical protein
MTSCGSFAARVAAPIFLAALLMIGAGRRAMRERP